MLPGGEFYQTKQVDKFSFNQTLRNAFYINICCRNSSPTLKYTSKYSRDKELVEKLIKYGEKTITTTAHCDSKK